MRETIAYFADVPGVQVAAIFGVSHSEWDEVVATAGPGMRMVEGKLLEGKADCSVEGGDYASVIDLSLIAYHALATEASVERVATDLGSLLVQELRPSVLVRLGSDLLDDFVGDREAEWSSEPDIAAQFRRWIPRQDRTRWSAIVL